MRSTFAICDDYQAFLESIPGDTLSTARRLPTRRRPKRRPAAGEIKAQIQRNPLLDVGTVLGRQGFAEYHADADEEGHLDFWHTSYLRFGYVVALSSHGDPIVQASSGRFTGRIYRTDHEFYDDWYETLAEGEDFDEVEDALRALGWTSYDEMTADQFFGLLTMKLPLDGLFKELAPSFEAFYAELCTRYGSQAI